MAPDVKTTTTELEDSRVRLTVEVEPAAVEREVHNAARELARDMRVPGFRKGKVPPPVVIQRVGRQAVLQEAVQHALGDWYEQAVGESGLSTVGEPNLDLDELPERGSPLKFSVEVGVRPRAKLGNYRGLEVGRRDPEVPQEKIDAEIDRLRDSVATLEAVERPAQEGDFLVCDFVGKVDGEPFEGGEARGYLIELGSGRLVEGFEQQLIGSSAGDELTVTITFPQEHQPEHLAGKEAVFDTTVREVKEKRIPEANDEFASEASGFETLAELRSDIEEGLRKSEEQQIDTEFREAAIDAAAAASQIEVPDDLVQAKGRQMWQQTAQQLRNQGIAPERYLQMIGKDEDQLVEESRSEAEQVLRRESVLEAIADAEGIEVTEQDLLEALRDASSGSNGAEPSEKQLKKSLARAREQGREKLLRQEIALRKAADLVVESATPISVEQARAREKIWTPGGEQGGAQTGEIWTPGS